RKELQVGIRYAGIDYSLEELNRDQAKLNRLGRRSDVLGIVNAPSIAVVAIVLLIALIIGGKYWIDGKQLDTNSKVAELELLQGLPDYQIAQIEQTTAMILLTDELKSTLGTDNLRRALSVNTNATS